MLRIYSYANDLECFNALKKDTKSHTICLRKGSFALCKRVESLGFCFVFILRSSFLLSQYFHHFAKIVVTLSDAYTNSTSNDCAAAGTAAAVWDAVSNCVPCFRNTFLLHVFEAGAQHIHTPCTAHTLNSHGPMSHCIQSTMKSYITCVYGIATLPGDSV